jgi:hypothetical protein
VKPDNGFGLIVAIFLILILSLLMLFSSSMFSTDIEIALDSLRSSQALFLCEGALNYCIKHELKDDSDWSDNTDTINKPLGRGTFSVYYDPNQTTATQTTVRVVATVDDITRQITRSFQSGGGWPDVYADFPYSLFTAGDLTLQQCSSASIETPYLINDPNCPNINWDFNYYYNNADVIMDPWWIADGDTNQVYTGIYYFPDCVLFTNCSNITYYGSIIVEGSLTFWGCRNFTIIPSGNNPAIVTGIGYILFKELDKKTPCEDINIQGSVFSEHYITLDAVNNFQITGIMYAKSQIEINNSSNFINNGSLISPTYIKFSRCDPVMNINWGSKVLDEPPGFTWGGGSGIIMGTWDEAL